MNLQNENALMQELEKAIVSGNEEEAREFIVQHFNEFPKETQDDILLGFLEEGTDSHIKSEFGNLQRRNKNFLELCSLLKEELLQEKNKV